MSNKIELLKELKNLFSDGKPFTMPVKEFEKEFIKIKDKHIDCIEQSKKIIYRVNNFEKTLSRVVSGPTKGIERSLNLFKMLMSYELLRFEIEFSA